MIKNIFFCLLFLIFFSCASKDIQTQFFFEKEAVILRIKTDNKLNVYPYPDGAPHSVKMCVYQLNDPTFVNDMSSTKEGIYELLKCEAIDNSIKSVKAIKNIQPRQETIIKIDRAKDCQYLSIVVGFCDSQPKDVYRLFEIPIEEKGIFNKEKIPAKFFQNIKLGAKGIE